MFIVCDKTPFSFIALSILGTSSLNINRVRRFSDNDQRTRNKRNATLSSTVSAATTTTTTSGAVKQEPAWAKYYGFESYKQRKAYQKNPNKSKCHCLEVTKHT